MADAHSKPNHDYHLVDPSPWPLIGSISAFLTAVGAVMWMKGLPLAGLKMGPYVFGAKSATPVAAVGAPKQKL